MAAKVTKVPEPSMRFRFVRGTWPPQPTPIPEQAKDAANSIKPNAASTRNYGKTPPLDGNTGTTGLT